MPSIRCKQKIVQNRVTRTTLARSMLFCPIWPHVCTDDAASSADHAWPKIEHGQIVGKMVNVDCRLMVTVASNATPRQMIPKDLALKIKMALERPLYIGLPTGERPLV
jgi:hypothetical protein